ncbi:MAG: hypothetical protein AABO41_28655 [Acidobacteriota bacterium]
MQSTKRIHLVLAVTLLLWPIYSTGAITQTPFRADQLEKKILPAPSLLAERGIYFFDLTIRYPTVIVNLYDASKAIQAVAELTEEPLQNRVTLKISPTNMEEAWITIERQMRPKRILLSIDSSVGSGFQVRLERAEGPVGSASIPIKSARVKVDGRWISLPFNDLRHQAGSDVNQLREIEQNRLFTTPSLQLLRALMHEYGGVLAQALNSGKGNITAQEAGCSVTCFHVAELLPLYYCDGGALSGCSCSAGEGFFFIGGCTWILPCSLGCGAFSPLLS